MVKDTILVLLLVLVGQEQIPIPTTDGVDVLVERQQVLRVLLEIILLALVATFIQRLVFLTVHLQLP